MNENTVPQNQNMVQQPEVLPQKRGRGRPKKVKPQEEIENEPIIQNTEEPPKKKRGRPRKIKPQEEQIEQEEVNLFGLVDEEEKVQEATMLPGFENEQNTSILPGFDNNSGQMNNNQAYFNQNQINGYQSMSSPYSQNYNNNYQNYNNTTQMESINQYPAVDLSNLITQDKKVVGFLGTTKNGTSFLVNNVAAMLAEKGIETAILDLTKSKNAYYIYTENDERLRKVAAECIYKLRTGSASGIQVSKNLTVYTSVPDDGETMADYSNILSTLIQNYSVVLLDCDFETPHEYFQNMQELYLVQTMDILTIQPLTAFLRDLKAKNALDPNKLKVVINKETKVKSLSDRVIIGGMAYYNDPSMSFMTELFNKDSIKYCTIPFDIQAYSKYLEGLVNCKISLNGYSKNFISSLINLVNMVYPLINTRNDKNYNDYSKNNKGFSNQMNSTLDRMKRNY